MSNPNAHTYFKKNYLRMSSAKCRPCHSGYCHWIRKVLPDDEFRDYCFIVCLFLVQQISCNMNIRCNENHTNIMNMTMATPMEPRLSECVLINHYYNRRYFQVVITSLSPPSLQLIGFTKIYIYCFCYHLYRSVAVVITISIIISSRSSSSSSSSRRNSK